MKQSKLVDILQRLSPKEQQQLSLFLESPFFNKNKKVILLFKILINKLTNNQLVNHTKKDISHLLEPNQAYQELRFNNFISKLLHLVYDFLAFQQFEAEPNWQQEALVKQLFDRDANRHLKGVINKWQIIQEKQVQSNATFHTAYAKRQGFQDRSELSNNNRRYHEYLQQQNDHLDYAYLLEKLRIACDMTSRNTVIQATYYCHLLPEIKTAILQDERYLKQVTLHIYWRCLQMLERQGEEDYYAFKEMLQAHSEHFSQEEVRTLYQYALNYSIKKINSGDSIFYEEIFGLYQAMLEKKLLSISGQFSQWSFKNIITTGIRLEAYDWTNDFIQDYQHQLPPEEQFNAITYNLAALAYAKGDYRTALQYLQNVEFTDTSYHLGAKIIQLKSYYELEEDEAFFSLIEAFRKYIRRNKQISSYRKTANAHFIQLTKELFILKRKIQLRDSAALKHWRLLQREMDDTSPIANKDWLQDILNGFRRQVL